MAARSFCTSASAAISVESRQPAPVRDRCSTQERVGFQRLLAGALQFEETDGAVAASNDEAGVQHSAGGSGARRPGRTQHAHPFPALAEIHFETGAAYARPAPSSGVPPPPP